MSDPVVQYSILASSESVILLEIQRRRLFRKEKYSLSFAHFTGTVYYDHSQPGRSRFNLEVGTQSITCRDRRMSESQQRQVARDAKTLVSNSAAPSTIQFSSGQISPKALRGFAVAGILTMGDRVRPLKINAMFATPKADQLELEGDFLFRFPEFGMKTPTSLFGLNRIADEALVQFHAYAVRSGAAAPA